MADDTGSITHVWDLMETISFAMLVTTDGEKLRSRPMSACVDREENRIYFLTDARNHKDNEIARNPNVNLAFADSRGRNTELRVAHGGTAPTIQPNPLNPSDFPARCRTIFPPGAPIGRSCPLAIPASASFACRDTRSFIADLNAP